MIHGIVSSLVVVFTAAGAHVCSSHFLLLLTQGMPLSILIARGAYFLPAFANCLLLCKFLQTAHWVLKTGVEDAANTEDAVDTGDDLNSPMSPLQACRTDKKDKVTAEYF